MRINTRDFFESFAKSTNDLVVENLMKELQENLFIGETSNSLYYEWNCSKEFLSAVLGGCDGRRYIAISDKNNPTAISVGVFDILMQTLTDPNEDMLKLIKFCVFCIVGRIKHGDSCADAINWFMHYSITENIVAGAVNTDILSVFDLTPDSIFSLGEITPLYGKREDSNSNTTIAEKKLTYEDLKSKYGSLFLEREFSEEEREMLQANADSVGEYYDPSPNVIELVKKVTKSFERPAHLRKTNILLEGGTGTGKTKDSQVFADIIGLPYTKITCFSDMDSSDVTGGIYPVFDSKTPKLSDLAIELAGFGIEITTNSAISESESSDEEELSEATEAPKSVKKKRHRRTKAEMEAARKAEEEANSSEDENISEKSEEESLDNAKESSSEDELKDTKANTKENEMEDLDIDEISFDYDGEDDDINSLMNLVDLESDNNSEVETSETSFAIDSEDVTEDLSIDNDLENALNVVVSTVANAHPRLKQFDGMTLREVLSQHKDACEVFIRERIVPQMSPEVVDASKIILKSRM